MPSGLKRYQREGDDHFITSVATTANHTSPPHPSKGIFLDDLELTRRRYKFEVLGYVVMPEHVPPLAQRAARPKSDEIEKYLQRVAFF